MRLKPVVIAAGFAGLLLIAGTLAVRQASQSGGGPGAAATALRPKGGAKVKPAKPATTTTYAELLRGVDGRIKGFQAVASKRDADWLIRAQLASALLERAGLTNQVDDFERVRKVLDESFEIAPGAAGPVDVAARFEFTVHRLEASEQLLDKLDARKIPRAEDRVTVGLLRAQIAMQRGDYAAAFEGLSGAAAAKPELGKSELALYYAKTGEPDQAEALYLELLEQTDPKKDPRRRAWLRLQHARVAMDRGRYRVALERLAEADAELPGWWLVQEQVAEAYAALGENEKAIAVYEEVVKLSDLPQAMDALAAAYQHANQKEKAQPLIERAETLWKDHLARLPEASMGHGLHHYLQFGPPEKALELAKANYAARPGLESPVLLARAYLKVDKPAEALEIANKAMATKYRSASLYDVASKAQAALGNKAAADELRERCFAINPFYQDLLHSH